MLTVVRAGSGAALADALAEQLAVPPPDPLAVDEVVVHSRGMERWLSQRLSRRLGAGAEGDGVCAAVAFPHPVDVVRRAVRAVGGVDPRDSAWGADRLVWALLAAADDGLDERWAAPLRARLDADPDDRWATLRLVADLLERYGAHRPDLVLRWLDGHDVGADGEPLSPADAWQPHLLRHLRQRIGAPTPAEEVVTAVAALEGGTGPLPGLPARLALFGFTALPAAHLAVLAALARRIDVALHLLHPSPALWEARAGVRGRVDADGLPVLPPRAAPGAPPPDNRLLRSWGRDAAELQLVVQTIAEGAATRSLDGTAGAAPGTLLGRVQQAVRDDVALVPGGGSALPADETLQVHACTGRARQVQVLRDEILRLLAADPTLEPRDVVVMCPDVEAFAPLVTAHLGVPADDPDGRPDLRVRLADRALRQVNPMLRVLDDLLDLAAGRVTATRLLDLAGADPVRRRFGFDPDALAQLERWAADSGMRWGLDLDDRGVVDVPEKAGTVQAGLSRVLLGVAMADEGDRTVGGTTPLDDAGGDVALAGRLAELVARLGRVLASLRDPQPIAGWADALTAAADLLMRPPHDDPWQRTQVTTLLDRIATSAGAGPAAVPLTLAEVRALLAEHLRGRPTWENHRTGDLTVCTLVPMRSVPHRVICLLGMDDVPADGEGGAGVPFPRRPHVPGDDLLARAPRVGDRDPRTEDRQLLLDAVMAATDAVVITYAGRDERTGQETPPCVPVAELLRALDAMAPGTADRITTTHPLHPHDPAAFDPARPGFDPQAHAAARARRAPRPAAPRDLPLPAGPVQPEVALDRLVGFAKDPARHFYRWTVGAWVPDDPSLPDAQVPLETFGLPEWQIADALLRSGALGDPDGTARVVAAMRGRGTLPPGALGEAGIAKAVQGAETVAAHCARLGVPLGGGSRRSVTAVLGDRCVVGAVEGLHGTRLVRVGYSKLGGKHLVAPWVELLVLTAADPATPWEAVVVGRHETKKEGRAPAPHGVRLPPLGDTPAARRAAAEELLGDLLALHDDGLREPLVVPPQAAAAYAKERLLRRAEVAAADDRAAAAWDHDDFFPGRNDADAPCHILRYGDIVPYRVLTTEPARPQDAVPGRDPEPHRFGALAVRLWAPLLARLEVAR